MGLVDPMQHYDPQITLKLENASLLDKDGYTLNQLKLL